MGGGRGGGGGGGCYIVWTRNVEGTPAFKPPLRLLLFQIRLLCRVSRYTLEIVNVLQLNLIYHFFFQMLNTSPVITEGRFR